MFRSVKRFVLYSLLWCSSPAFADQYLLFWQEGQKPERKVFFASMESAGITGDVRSLAVTEIYESSDGPFASEFHCEFRISDNKCRLTRGIDYFRDDERKKEYSHPAWQEVPYNWQRRAFEFAAEEPLWRNAFKLDLHNARLTGGGEQRALAAQNCLYAGQHFWPSSLDQFTWTNLWSDGVRPRFTSSKPLEVQERERAEFIAYLEWAQRLLGGYAAAGRSGLKEMELEAEFEKAKRESAERRPFSRMNKQLESWIGRKESELVAQQGPPSFTKDEKGLRTLTYRSTRAEDLLATQQGAVMPVGRREYRVDVTYFILHGRIYNFAVTGNDPNML